MEPCCSICKELNFHVSSFSSFKAAYKPIYFAYSIVLFGVDVCTATGGKSGSLSFPAYGELCYRLEVFPEIFLTTIYSLCWGMCNAFPCMNFHSKSRFRFQLEQCIARLYGFWWICIRLLFDMPVTNSLTYYCSIYSYVSQNLTGTIFPFRFLRCCGYARKAIVMLSKHFLNTVIIHFFQEMIIGGWHPLKGTFFFSPACFSDDHLSQAV